MTYTMEELNQKTRKDIYIIAKDIAHQANVTRISKYKKSELIELICKHQPVADPNPELLIDLEKSEKKIEFASVPSPEVFFNLVIELDTRLEVTQACNALLKILREKHTVASISWKLSAYKEFFYKYQSKNQKLNEPVETKRRGLNTQHIAANLLSLSEDENRQLKYQREVAKDKKAGFDDDGNPRKLNLPQRSISQIIKKACDLATSSSSLDIVCGLLPLTGLRANEIGLKEFLNNGELITRKCLPIGENLIGFYAPSKKHGRLVWIVKPTLAPAKFVARTLNTFWSTPTDYKLPKLVKKFSKSGFYEQLRDRFKEIWSEEFNTIQAFDDSGNKTNDDASTHKSRAFYIWAINPILIKNEYTIEQAKIYLQNCLGHDDSKETEKYLQRYNEKAFTDFVSLNIPLSKNSVGETPEEKIMKMHEEFVGTLPKQPAMNEINLERLEASLSDEMRVKFAETLMQTQDVTSALIKLLNTCQTPIPSVREQTYNAVDTIIIAVMEYNQSVTEKRDIVVPNYPITNRIYKALYGKEIGKSTYGKSWDRLGKDVTERLTNREIDLAKHNGAYHRKNLSEKLDKIMTMISA